MQRYIVVKHFEDVQAVDRRFTERGRMMPDGLVYVSSWIDDKLERCFQLMETPDRALLEDWMSKWTDLMDFEVYPVITSKEAAETISDPTNKQTFMLVIGSQPCVSSGPDRISHQLLPVPSSRSSKSIPTAKLRIASSEQDSFQVAGQMLPIKPRGPYPALASSYSTDGIIKL